MGPHCRRHLSKVTTPNEVIIKMLLEKGAEVNAQGGHLEMHRR